MTKAEYNGHVLELYDSPQELPINRFQVYNLNAMLDSGIGSDLNGFHSRYQEIRNYIRRDPEAALRAFDNMMMNVQFVMSKTSPELMSFVALIYKVNGRLTTDDDLTEEGVQRMIEYLSKRRIPIGFIQRILAAVKKKLGAELEQFFNELVNNASVKDLYSRLCERTLLLLQSVDGMTEEVAARIQAIDNFILDRVKPKQYHGPEGLEVATIANFEENCVLLAQHGVSDNPRKMTVIAFYTAMDVIRKQAKAREKADTTGTTKKGK